MNEYERVAKSFFNLLATQRQDDEWSGFDIMVIQEGVGLIMLDTVSHGYLVVPKQNKYYDIAQKVKSVCSYKINDFIFLEEDNDRSNFLEQVRQADPDFKPYWL